MKIPLLLSFTLLLSTVSAAQPRANESILAQIKELRSENITLSHDAGSNVSTLRAVSENFSDDEAKSAGVRAVNFAAGLLYPGKALAKADAPLLLSFWVLGTTPKFGDVKSVQIYAGDQLVELQGIRYVHRARDGMEYLNVQLAREQLKTIALQSDARMLLGRHQLTFTKSQMKLLADLYMVTDLSPEQ